MKIRSGFIVAMMLLLGMAFDAGAATYTAQVTSISANLNKAGLTKARKAELLKELAELVQLNPKAAAEIAAAVAQLVPSIAAEIAATVSKEVPSLAAEIAATVSKEVPSLAAEIAGAVVEVVPSAAEEVVAAVIKVNPSVEAEIENAVVVALVTAAAATDEGQTSASPS